MKHTNLYQQTRDYLTHITIMAHADKVQTIRTEYLKPAIVTIMLIHCMSLCSLNTYFDPVISVTVTLRKIEN